jgi:hypothetical protein
MSLIIIRNILLQDAHLVQIKFRTESTGLRIMRTGSRILIKANGSKKTSQKKMFKMSNTIAKIPRIGPGRKFSIFYLLSVDKTGINLVRNLIFCQMSDLIFFTSGLCLVKSENLFCQQDMLYILSFF